MEKVSLMKEEKKVMVYFDTKFYPSECVFKAARDFSESCWTSVDGNSENLQVMLKPKSEGTDLNNLGYDFYNYVLSIIKNDGKVQEIAKRFG